MFLNIFHFLFGGHFVQPSGNVYVILAVVNIRHIYVKLFQRTSDSLNEGLPIKMARNKFQRKR